MATPKPNGDTVLTNDFFPFSIRQIIEKDRNKLLYQFPIQIAL